MAIALSLILQQIRLELRRSKEVKCFESVSTVKAYFYTNLNLIIDRAWCICSNIKITMQHKHGNKIRPKLTLLNTL